MALPARKTDFDAARKPRKTTALATRKKRPHSPIMKHAPADVLANPVIIDADAKPAPIADVADSALAQAKLKLVSPAGNRNKKDHDSAVVTGLRDLQQLQKQTIAVLDAVKGNLEDIRQVLRSPEATRGMEKQQNAAALLGRGFSEEASVQARGAVELLPANPEAHLLLSLSLAANQEFDEALSAARKGLALFDRTQHPLAIEAGLLHAIGALGHGVEAAQRWAEIIDALPLPIFLDHLGRIAVCYPSNAPEGQLDRTLARRLERDADAPAAEAPMRQLFDALDSAALHNLGETHRALLLRITMLCRSLREPAEILRFLGDYVVGLAERDEGKTADALANRCAKKLLKAQADAPTLYRALLKMELANVGKPAFYIARLLAHWRAVGKTLRLTRTILVTAVLVLIAGGSLFALSALNIKALPAAPWFKLAGVAIGPLHLAFTVLGLGITIALTALFRQHIPIDLPYDRPRLSAQEIRYLRTREVKDTLKRFARRQRAN